VFSAKGEAFIVSLGQRPSIQSTSKKSASAESATHFRHELFGIENDPPD